MTELIEDPAFTTMGQPDSCWVIQTHESCKIKPTVVDGELNLHVRGTRGANWHGELRYTPFPVEVGYTYTMSLEGRSERPFTFSIWLGMANPPFSSLVPSSNHFGDAWLRPQWQTYTHTWVPTTTDEAARLNLVIGQIDTKIAFRNVRMNCEPTPTDG